MRGVERYRRADDALSLSRAFLASAEAAELRRHTNLEEWHGDCSATEAAETPPDKGKPTARWGRKATGQVRSDLIAGLPKERVTSRARWSSAAGGSSWNAPGGRASVARCTLRACRRLPALSRFLPRRATAHGLLAWSIGQTRSAFPGP